MRSTPGTARNTGATDGRAATSAARPEKCRRTSRIAGSAITASPSQFGASDQNASDPLIPLSDCEIGFGRREHAGRGIERGRLARRASADASTTIAPDDASRASRARRCSAA